jgi:hypothetical protein
MGLNMTRFDVYLVPGKCCGPGGCEDLPSLLDEMTRDEDSE